MIKLFEEFINENNFYKYKHEDKELKKLRQIEFTAWKYKHQVLKKFPADGVDGSKKLSDYRNKWGMEARILGIYDDYIDGVKILAKDGSKLSYNFGDVLA